MTTAALYDEITGPGWGWSHGAKPCTNFDPCDHHKYKVGDTVNWYGHDLTVIFIGRELWPWDKSDDRIWLTLARIDRKGKRVSVIVRTTNPDNQPAN